MKASTEKASPRYTASFKSEPVAWGAETRRNKRSGNGSKQKATNQLRVPPLRTLGIGWTLNDVASALGATPGRGALRFPQL